jgi:hypothetical protein
MTHDLSACTAVDDVLALADELPEVTDEERREHDLLFANSAWPTRTYGGHGAHADFSPSRREVDLRSCVGAGEPNTFVRVPQTRTAVTR